MKSVLFITGHPAPYRNHVFDHLNNLTSELNIHVLYWKIPDARRGWNENVKLKHNYFYLDESYKKLYQKIIELKPSLIVIGGLTPAFAIFSIVIARYLKIKYAIQSESVDLKIRSKFTVIFRDFIYKILLKKVNLIFPTSHYAHKYLSKYVSADMPSVIFPNAPDFNEINTIINLHRKHHPSNWSDHRQVLFVGRLVREKGVDTLLRAWQICENENTNIRLVIIGDGIEKKNLINLSQKLKLQHILFAGIKTTEETFQYFSFSHLFVLPSKEEPYGAVASEAISAGLPIVISDRVGSREEVLKHGENGFLFNYYDYFDLANKILEILSDEEKWLKMCNASLNIAKNFTSHNIGSKIVKAINQVI